MPVESDVALPAPCRVERQLDHLTVGQYFWAANVPRAGVVRKFGETEVCEVGAVDGGESYVSSPQAECDTSTGEVEDFGEV